MREPKNEPYIIRGKKIAARLFTSPSRTAFWLLPGEMVSKAEAKGMGKYRKKSFQLRRSAASKGYLVDVGSHLLVTETLVFTSVSDAVSFVLGGSRSGDHARAGKKKLTGKNLRGGEE